MYVPADLYVLLKMFKPCDASAHKWTGISFWPPFCCRPLPSPPPPPTSPLPKHFLPLCMTCEQFVSVICIYLPGVVTFLFVHLFLFQGVFWLLFVWLFALSAVGGGGLVILFTTLKLVCHFADVLWQDEWESFWAKHGLVVFGCCWQSVCGKDSVC